MRKAFIIVVLLAAIAGCSNLDRAQPSSKASPAERSFGFQQGKKFYECSSVTGKCVDLDALSATPSPPPSGWYSYCTEAAAERESGQPCRQFKFAATKRMIYARIKDTFARKFWLSAAERGYIVTDTHR